MKQTQQDKNRFDLSTRRAVRALTGLTLLIGLGVGLHPAPAVAAPSSMTTDEFYSDETFTESVGIRVVNSCYGVVNEVYGEVTPYVIRETSSCNHPSPPEFSTWYCPDYGCEKIDGVLHCTVGECELL